MKDDNVLYFSRKEKIGACLMTSPTLSAVSMTALQAFPALTQEEFSAACKAFEQRSEDKLNETTWLSVKWTGEELLIRLQRKAFCNGLNSGKTEEGAEQRDESEEIEDLVEEPCTRPEVCLFDETRCSLADKLASRPRSRLQKISSSLIVPSRSHRRIRSLYCGSPAEGTQTPSR